MPVPRADRSLPSVPRSKGCLTCVSRKTRCDGRRPTCLACENRKQMCGGYRRQEVVFMSEGWRAPGVASRTRGKMTTSDNPSESALPTSTGSILPCSQTSADLVLYSSPATKRSYLHIPFFLASFGTRPFQALTFIGEIFQHYFSLASPSILDGPTPPLSPSTPVVLAVNALAQGYFGTVNADPLSVRQSQHSYGTALRSMSARLAECRLADPDFQNISEEDWQHLAFFCIVTMFWEMKMSPASRNWQSHIRGLAAAILLRGADHAYSETNYRLLGLSRLFIILQTLSTRQPTFLSSHDWRRRSPISSAWLIEVKSMLEASGTPKFSTDFELHTSTDALMTEVTTIASVMAQYDQLLNRRPSTGGTDDEATEHILVGLYDTAESILFRNEQRLARWSSNICEVSLSSWLSIHQNVTADPISGYFWSSLNEPDVLSYFDTVLSFRTMMEYHTIILYWTILMSLRLLMRDMLALMAKMTAHELPAQPRQTIEDHRVQLMSYALKVLQAICYATLPESRAVTPFFLATAFQLTVAVLDQEHKSLQAAGSNQETIRRCGSLKSLAAHYLDWAMQNKIPIKLDFDAPREWKCESVVQLSQLISLKSL